MTIANYSDLTSAISDRLARADMSAGAPTVAECIVLCEAEMRRRLRTLDMETIVAPYVIAAEYSPVPPDFAQVRDFYLNTSPRIVLDYRSPEMITRSYPLATADVPMFYSVIGKQFRFGPPPAAQYNATLTYYAKIPALVTSLTNWVINDHPDAYLYGSLVQAGIRLQNADMVAGYQQYFERALEQAQASSNKARWSGPGLATVPG